jgi:hypothetical protein
MSEDSEKPDKTGLPPNDLRDRQKLKGASVKGVAVTYVAQILRFALQFISQVISPRLLMPRIRNSMGAATHWRGRMRLAWGHVNARERSGEAPERWFRWSHRTSASPKGASPGRWLGTESRRRERTRTGREK